MATALIRSSLINTEVLPFNATAYHNGKNVKVSEANLKGTWSVLFFYPADFTFVCPASWMPANPPLRRRPPEDSGPASLPAGRQTSRPGPRFAPAATSYNRPSRTAMPSL